jgi:hypothetical protein
MSSERMSVSLDTLHAILVNMRGFNFDFSLKRILYIFEKFVDESGSVIQFDGEDVKERISTVS